MNAGYTVVVPSDCVASDPPEYAEHALKYTMRNIAFVVPSATIVAAAARNDAPIVVLGAFKRSAACHRGRAAAPAGLSGRPVIDEFATATPLAEY